MRGGGEKNHGKQQTVSMKLKLYKKHMEVNNGHLHGLEHAHYKNASKIKKMHWIFIYGTFR